MIHSGYKKNIVHLYFQSDEFDSFLSTNTYYHHNRLPNYHPLVTTARVYSSSTVKFFDDSETFSNPFIGDTFHDFVYIKNKNNNNKNGIGIFTTLYYYTGCVYRERCSHLEVYYDTYIYILYWYSV